ncbi:MAG: glycine dehydrogenase (aminomethyl-transferring) [archaeon]|nr:glycine dehydrogenase (aminomethyl-transferring) [archaeon]
MLSKGVNKSLLSSFMCDTFSTISRSMYLEKLRNVKPELKSRPFTFRHLGPNEKDISSMLNFLGVESLTDLMNKAMPSNIIHTSRVRDAQAKVLGEASSEETTTAYLQAIADKNEIYKNYIGLGFNPNHLPASIQMNVFMNPTWLTSYTPYQAEISQGRLEALMNFQTLISELTGHDIGNASLLDEGSSAAEAMYMCWNISDFKKNKFFIDSNVFSYIKKCVRTKAHFLGIEVIEGDWEKTDIDNTFCGGLVQNPGNDGIVRDLSAFAKKIKNAGGISVIDCDIASLLMVKSPKEQGFDVALGNTQRFGIPLCNGGPHCGFFSCDDKHKRKMPGRIIGISKDVEGNVAYRLSLQTREQHIRRNKATSNICTAQALIANISGFYAMYHGKTGLIRISERINRFTNYLIEKLSSLGLNVVTKAGTVFDTFAIKYENIDQVNEVIEKFRENKINIRKFDGENKISLTLNETTTLGDVEEIIKIFMKTLRKNSHSFNIENEISNVESAPLLDDGLRRDTTRILNQEIFSKYSSEHQIIRYIRALEDKDISLTTSMIPLGSCTMKLNPASAMLPIFWNKFTDIHPFAPECQKQGYAKMIKETEEMLKTITQFDGVSLQPNSGATGEYSGLLTIRRYQESIGESHRNICFIPNSAHGTNFASAHLCGFKIIVIDTDENGNISLSDLKKKLAIYKNELGAMMITYPSTNGIYERDVMEMCKLVHENGGQCYMDGANMNAQVCNTSPGKYYLI